LPVLQDNSREIVDLTVSLFFQQVNIVSLFVGQLRIFFPISLLFLVRLSLLSNSSMETYVQNPKWFDIEHPTTNRGCFGCHNYNPDKKNALHLSHMFNAAKDYGPCKKKSGNLWLESN
jgi:hypothetical protein